MAGEKGILDIEYLKEENRRLREKLDKKTEKLKSATDLHSKLQIEFEKFKSDQDQIFKYLSQENESKDEEIANLNNEVRRLESEGDKLKEDFGEC